MSFEPIQVAPEGSDHSPKFKVGEINEIKEKLDKELNKRGLKNNQRGFKYGNKKKKD